MRISYSTYLGPYLKMKDPMKDLEMDNLCRICNPTTSVFDGYIYLIPSSNDKTPRKFNNYISTNIFTPISSNEISEEINWFKNTFSNEIKELEKLSDVNDCVVEWGQIVYVN